MLLMSVFIIMSLLSQKRQTIHCFVKGEAVYFLYWLDGIDLNKHYIQIIAIIILLRSVYSKLWDSKFFFGILNSS